MNAMSSTLGGPQLLSRPARPLPMLHRTRPVGVRCSAMADRDPFESMFMREMAFMDRQMEQMDADMARIMEQSRRMEADATRQANEAIQRAQQEIADSGVRVYRSEERGLNSYRYQQTITISSAPRYVYSVTQAAPALGPSPWLFAALMLTGAYTALAAAFARNIRLTTYQDQAAWRLAPQWPLLLVTSRTFREQFWAAVRGVKPRLKDIQDQEGP